MLPLGSLKQKAHPVLVTFVFMCTVVIIGLLYLLQKTEAVADNYVSDTSLGSSGY